MSSDQRRILGRRIVQPAASPTMPGKVVRKKKSRSMLTPTSEVSLPLRSEVKEAKVEPVQREETRVAENKEEFRNETVSFILKQREIDLGKLQRRCWHGIEPQFRAKAWLVLLGVVPRQHGRQSDVLGRRIREYAHFVSEYRANLSPDHYGRLSPEVAKAFHQIDLDLPRTNPSSRLFQCKRARDCIQRVLRVYSVRHPATGYVQGMNDLITPLIYVFTADEVNIFDEYSEAVDEALEHVTEERWIAIEGMVFVCLCRILDGIQDHFTRDQPGIQRKLYQVSELVTRLNPALATFLDDIGVQWNMFAYRWMVCFLVRQLGPNLGLVLRIWDTYLSEGPVEGFSCFHIYVCAALMGWLFPRIKECDLEGFLLLMQSQAQALDSTGWGMELRDVEEIMSQAFVYKALYVIK